MLKESTNLCTFLYLLLISLYSEWFVKCNTNLNKIELIKLSEYDNLLPSLEHFLMELKDMDHIECTMACLMNKLVCAGVFYNNLTKFCKLPTNHPNESMVYDTQPGWEFWKNIGCDPGWLYHSEHCYLLTHRKTSWHDAQLQCESNGAFLAEIKSAKENSWITEKLMDTNMFVLQESQGLPDFTEQVWIGANDIDNEDSFIWSETNSTLNFSNWNQGEPNDEYGEDCLAIIHKTGKWNDLPCSSNLSYICEKRK
ncbi:perlucin-like protein [Saccostrea echinata]|uniref:perlucin-like protein n=1 Tax=Saccostrea echinata TaxID=191078 RepID=UPI002A80B044|nr:perlucin-like protein [Saccostrea echinata]